MTTKVNNNRKIIRRVCISAACIALAIVLPFLTGQIPEIGRALCPMHIPAFLSGALCGPVFGAFVGFLSPILRSLIFSAPMLYPTGVCMAVELMFYAVSFSLLLKLFSKKYVSVYFALVPSMVVGRIAGGFTQAILYSFGKISEFGLNIFMTSYFIDTIPGTVLQLVLIPPVLYALKKAKIGEDK